MIDVAEEEAASRALFRVLSRTSGLVRKGFATVFGEKAIEIDVVFRFGNYLFLFECKHALHPCNAHELRNSYEHMKRGAQTLTRIIDLLKDNDVEVELYKRLGWDVPPATEIVTCIVSCNGMFPGLSISGHPVRRWPELWNMIESGVVRVGSIRVVEEDGKLGVQDDYVVERKLWSGPELRPEFLRGYIMGERTHQALFGAMIPWERRFRLGESELIFSTFLLDPMAAQKQIEDLPQ